MSDFKAQFKYATSIISIITLALGGVVGALLASTGGKFRKRIRRGMTRDVIDRGLVSDGYPPINVTLEERGLHPGIIPRAFWNASDTDTPFSQFNVANILMSIITSFYSLLISFIVVSAIIFISANTLIPTVKASDKEGGEKKKLLTSVSPKDLLSKASVASVMEVFSSQEVTIIAGILMFIVLYLVYSIYYLKVQHTAHSTTYPSALTLYNLMSGLEKSTADSAEGFGQLNTELYNRLRMMYWSGLSDARFKEILVTTSHQNIKTFIMNMRFGFSDDVEKRLKKINEDIYLSKEISGNSRENVQAWNNDEVYVGVKEALKKFLQNAEDAEKRLLEFGDGMFIFGICYSILSFAAFIAFSGGFVRNIVLKRGMNNK